MLSKVGKGRRKTDTAKQGHVPSWDNNAGMGSAGGGGLHNVVIKAGNRKLRALTSTPDLICGLEQITLIYLCYHSSSWEGGFGTSRVQVLTDFISLRVNTYAVPTKSA